MSTLKEKIDALRPSLRGEVLLPGDGAFDAARSRVFNQMYSSSVPAVVFQPLGASDVSKAVVFASENGLKVVVRSGGHSGSGASSTNGGVLIDLSKMRGVQVDAAAKTVQVQAGAELGDIDIELGHYGLATPVGAYAHTGAGGLVLHGGLGLLTKKHGASVDNLLEAEIVTADGKVHVVNENSEPELFWGVRGAASNFGVVTRFLLKAHTIDTDVYGGTAVLPAVNLKEVLKHWAASATGDADFNADLFLLAPPNGPPMGLVMNMGAHFGDKGKAEGVLNRFIELGGGKAAMGGFNHQPWYKIQLSSEPFFKGAPPSSQRWTCMLFDKLDDELIDCAVKAWEDLKQSKFGPTSLMIFEFWGGKLAEIPPSANPFNVRKPSFSISGIVGWIDPSLANDSTAAIAQWESHFGSRADVNQAYFNYHPTNKAEKTYGPANAKKLFELKAKLDPNNLFSGSLNRRSASDAQ